MYNSALPDTWKLKTTSPDLVGVNTLSYVPEKSVKLTPGAKTVAPVVHKLNGSVSCAVATGSPSQVVLFQ